MRKHQVDFEEAKTVFDDLMQISTRENSMLKEYDFSKGVRGKFYGKVDTANPVVEIDGEPLDEVFEDELTVLESNLVRIQKLESRFAELDEHTRQEVSKRIFNAREVLDKLSISK